jgi:hypothetical protein
MSTSIHCFEDVSTVIHNLTFFGRSSRPNERIGLMDASCMRRYVRFIALCILFVSCLPSCGSDVTNPAPDLANVYWRLQLNHEDVNLALRAPYDTVQLTAMPLNARGDTLGTLGQVRYQATDSSVTVSPTGLVTARFATDPGEVTSVIASLQDAAQSVTHADTVFLVVTPAPDTIVTFSMQPVAGDSAKRSVDFNRIDLNFKWLVTAINAAGQTMCSTADCQLVVHYTSSNPAVAYINPFSGEMTLQDTGRVILTATTLAWNTELRDSVELTIGPMLNWAVGLYLDNIGVGISWEPTSLSLGVGAVMDVLNIGNPRTRIPIYAKDADSIVISFTGPAPVDSASDMVIGFPPTGSGNITFSCDKVTNPRCISPNELVKARRFTSPGLYQVHFSMLPSKTFYITVK